MEHEGADREQMDQALQALGGRGGGFGRGGGGGFGGGPPAGFQDRPGESPVGVAGGRGGGRGGFGGGQRALFTALRDRGMSIQSLFGGGGGGQAALVGPGTYTVSMTVGERTLTTTFEVVRAEGYDPNN